MHSDNKTVTLQCASRFVAVPHQWKGGKSGQHRAPYFLTGRGPIPKYRTTDSATENIPPLYFYRGKGEKVG